MILINQRLIPIFNLWSSKRVHWLIKLMVLLIGFLSAAVSSADVAERVGQDIKQFISLKAQSKFLVSENNNGGFVTIGADAGCDFDSAVDSIQVAIDAGNSEIRVATNGNYLNNLTIENKSVVIRGGFDDCSAANANQVSSDLTVINGNALAEPVIYITGSDVSQQIRLENLTLTGGTSVSPKFGGGISVQLATVDLQLVRVGIIGNTGSAGAGLYINAGSGSSSTETSVTGRDVVFQFNNSSSIGAGMFCRGAADVVLGGMSLFDNNSAGLGGAMYLVNGCSVSMYSELFSDSLSNTLAGLYNNFSASNGGGAHVIGGGELYLFGQRMCEESVCLGSNQFPIAVVNNVSGSGGGLDENGGGIYLAQSYAFYANGLMMSGNAAGDDGGGIYVGNNGDAMIERAGSSCWNLTRCNLIIDNSSGTDFGFGGGIHVKDGTIDVSQTFFEENRADFGTAISATGEAATVTLEGTVFDDNGNQGTDGYSDFEVINASLGAVIEVKHSTFAENDVTNTIFNIDPALGSSMSLLSSVVWDANSGNLFSGTSGPLVVDCLITHENNSFSGTNVVIGNPFFVDTSSGDFHLAAKSPAIDLCQEIPMGHPLDLDNETRGWDDPENSDGAGIFDAGADESYVNDIIFINGFEN